MYRFMTVSLYSREPVNSSNYKLSYENTQCIVGGSSILVFKQMTKFHIQKFLFLYLNIYSNIFLKNAKVLLK